MSNQFYLGQNYPNPFNPSTTIDYSIAQKLLVNLKVYDVLGREVAVLVNNSLKPTESYSEVFTANNLPSGVYFYRLTAGEFYQTKKLILFK